jgi:hypothetical protein
MLPCQLAVSTLSNSQKTLSWVLYSGFFTGCLPKLFAFLYKCVCASEPF